MPATQKFSSTFYKRWQGFQRDSVPLCRPPQRAKSPNLKGAFLKSEFAIFRGTYNSKVDACVNFRKKALAFFTFLQEKKFFFSVPNDSFLLFSQRENKNHLASGTKKAPFFLSKRGLLKNVPPEHFSIHHQKCALRHKGSALCGERPGAPRP